MTFVICSNRAGLYGSDRIKLADPFLNIASWFQPIGTAFIAATVPLSDQFYVFAWSCLFRQEIKFN